MKGYFSKNTEARKTKEFRVKDLDQYKEGTNLELKFLKILNF